MIKAPVIKRIDTLDLLRGYFLIVIMLNHMHFYPSVYEFITGQSFLYVSTAEGFFLISGMVLGIVRGAKLIDRPFKQAAKLLLKRSWQLYLTSVILVILFTLIGWLLIDNPNIKSGIYLPAWDFAEMIWRAITLQYAYGWADYLRLYAIFMLSSPIALWLLRKGRWYVVLTISTIVWALYPYRPWESEWLSQPISWQILFFYGFVIGFHWLDIHKIWNRIPTRKRTIIKTAVVVVGFTTIVASALFVFGHDLSLVGPVFANAHHAVEDYFSKYRLPAPRLILFGVWFMTFYWVFQRYDKQIKRWLGWILLPFGQNSLYTYTIQAFVVFAVMLVYQDIGKSSISNFLVSTIAIAIVYLAVKKKFLMKIIPR